VSLFTEPIQFSISLAVVSLHGPEPITVLMMLFSVPGNLPGYLVLGYDIGFPFVTPYPTASISVGDLKVTTLLGWQLSAFRTLIWSFPNRSINKMNFLKSQAPITEIQYTPTGVLEFGKNQVIPKKERNKRELNLGNPWIPLG